MKNLNTLLVTGLAALLLATGCDNDQVALDDVENARVEADRAAADLREVEENAAERIREKEAELNEVVDQEQERIARERAEALEAQSEAVEVARKFDTQEARELYLEEQRVALEEAGRRIKLLDAEYGELNEDEREVRKARFNQLHELHDEAKVKLNDLDGADADVWNVRQRSVDDAMQRLQVALNDYDQVD